MTPGITGVRTTIVRKTASSTAYRIVLGGILVAVFAALSRAQTSYQRTFPQSKAAVEKALTTLQSSMAGHLPVLEGFAKPGEHPLDRYQRAYYQSTVQVSSTPSGGSIVRITTKVTAWYADSVGSHSGYQLLTSNGRLESDLLDQLAEQLAKGSNWQWRPVHGTAAAILRTISFHGTHSYATRCTTSSLLHRRSSPKLIERFRRR